MELRDSDGNRRPMWVTAAWLLSPAVVVVLFALVWVARGTDVTQAVTDGFADGSIGSQGFACVEAYPLGREGYGKCDRLAAEVARRSPVSKGDRASADRTARTLREQLADWRMRRCPAQPCLTGDSPPPSVQELQDWLVETGYPRAYARTAGGDDPAPAGSVLYGVRVGSACVLGHVGADGSDNTVLGALPDGTCLST